MLSNKRCAHPVVKIDVGVICTEMGSKHIIPDVRKSAVVATEKYLMSTTSGSIP